MAEVPGPANAETRIDWLGRHGDVGLYRLEPRTGRKHQLRVHMAALGLPICGDPLYPQVISVPGVDDWSRPLQLLAAELSFVDPLSGQARHFASGLRLADRPPLVYPGQW